MKFTKTDFHKKVNEGSSWKVYVCKKQETAYEIHKMMMTAGTSSKDNYWHVSTIPGDGHCVIVPEFFHDSPYWFTVIEHNNGDWNNEQTYELYIVE